MKNLLIILSLVIAYQGHAAEPKPVDVPVTDVYVPEGFDTNDNSQVVIAGFLPNLCYKAPKATYKVEGKSIKVSMQSLYHNPTGFCLEMIVPYTEVVNLDVLDKGKYNIEVNVGSDWQKQAELTVNESSSDAIDEHVYANVTYIEIAENPASRTVKLKGWNPSECMQLDEVKLSHNKKDTFAILPVMKQVWNHCPMKMTPFEIEVDIPKELERDLVLLHVRSMDGKSVNTVFPNYR